MTIERSLKSRPTLPKSALISLTDYFRIDLDPALINKIVRVSPKIICCIRGNLCFGVCANLERKELYAPNSSLLLDMFVTRNRLKLSSKNVNATNLSMNVATVAPGAIAYAHIHDGFELMLYIMQGRVRHIFGDQLQHTVDNEAGDFIYIEPGVPHEVYNLSESEPVVAVVARSDASEWQNIIPFPSEARTRDNVHE